MSVKTQIKVSNEFEKLNFETGTKPSNTLFLLKKGCEYYYEIKDQVSSEYFADFAEYCNENHNSPDVTTTQILLDRDTNNVVKDIIKEWKEMKLPSAIKKLKGNYKRKQEVCHNLVIYGIHAYRQEKNILPSSTITSFSEWLSITKEKIIDLQNGILSDIECGVISASEFMALRYSMNKVLFGSSSYQGKNFEELLRKAAIDEVGSESVNVGSLVASAMESGVKYDYSNDNTWVEINEQIKKHKQELNKRQEVLKKLTFLKPKITGDLDGEHQIIYPDEMYDENGDLLSPPIKTSTTTVKIEMAK